MAVWQLDSGSGYNDSDSGRVATLAVAVATVAEWQHDSGSGRVATMTVAEWLQ
jgi:hypothetical protein